MEESAKERTIVTAHPPAPHFDDKTITSARRVVPIARAKANESSPIIRRAPLFILVAGILGTLTGGGIGFYAVRPRISPTVVTHSSINPKPIPDDSATSQQSTSKEANTEESSVVPADRQSTGAANSANSIADRTTTSSEENADRRDSPNSFSRLTHKHRLHQPNKPALSNKYRVSKRGAGHIQEIFSGPNPP
jgi:hypothetical protein